MAEWKKDAFNCLQCEMKLEDPTCCPKCLLFLYCSQEHMKEHAKLHRQKCYPLRMKRNKSLKRHLVTTKDVLAGDIILKEAAMISSPFSNSTTQNVCFTCGLDVTGRYKCNKCRWPFCNKRCLRHASHRPECEKTIRVVGKKEAILKTKDIYHYIFAIRCLYYRTRNPEMWKRIQSLESHNLHRTNVKDGTAKDVFQSMKAYFHLDDDCYSDMIHLIGVYLINAFSFRGTSKMGLYDKGSYLSHSCTPNAFISFTDKEEIVVKASVYIPANHIIYVSYTDYSFCYMSRQSYLKITHFFKCKCRRCNDPTDMGGHYDSVKCRKCNVGLLCRTCDMDNNWKCDSCAELVPYKTCIDTSQYWNRSTPDLNNIAACHAFLEMSELQVGEWHFTRMRVYLHLFLHHRVLDHGSPSTLENLSIIDNKISLGETLLGFYGRMYNGFHPFKGRIQMRLMQCLLWKYNALVGNRLGKNTHCETIMRIKKISDDMRLIYLQNSMCPEERRLKENAFRVSLKVCNIQKKWEY